MSRSLPSHLELLERLRCWFSWCRDDCVRNEDVDVESGTEISISFLFSTSSGVYLYDVGRVRRLVRGFCFGLAKEGDRLFFTRELYRNHRDANYRCAQILTGCFDGYTVSDVQVLRTGLCGGAHQIAVHEDVLYYVDGARNCIVKMSLLDRDRYGYDDIETLPVPSDDARPIVHMNSICVQHEMISILAHNDFARTGRNSAIYKMDHRGVPLAYHELDARGAHDIVSRDGHLYICNSQDGTVLCDDEEVFRCPLDLHVRGLMLGDTHNVIGGSEKTPRRERESTTTYIFFTDKRFVLQSVLKIGRLRDGGWGGNLKAILPLE